MCQLLNICCTSIRLRSKSDVLEDVINNLERNLGAVCYTSFDSNDLIICIRRSSYGAGYNAINRFENEIKICAPHNGIKKGFTVFCIWQEVLNGIAGISVSKAAQKEINKIVNETGITPVLYGNIKDKSELTCFLDNIKSNRSIDSAESYGIMGSEDIAIKLKLFYFKEFLMLYGDKQLLTHANPLYQRIFYNIRTEIWCGY